MELWGIAAIMIAWSSSGMMLTKVAIDKINHDLELPSKLDVLDKLMLCLGGIFGPIFGLIGLLLSIRGTKKRDD